MPPNHGDTVTISRYETLNFMTLLDSNRVCNLSTPTEQSLWIIGENNGQYTIKSLSNGRYIAQGTSSTSEIILNYTPCYYQYNSTLKTLSIGNFRFNISNNLWHFGYQLKTNIYYNSYTRASNRTIESELPPLKVYNWNTISDTMLIHFIEMNSYTPLESVTYHTINDTTELPYSLSIADSWFTYQDSIFTLSPIAIPSGRTTLVELSVPNINKQQLMKVIQLGDPDSLQLIHRPGKFDPRFNAEGMQTVHEIEKTIYIKSNESRDLPLNQEGIYARLFLHNSNGVLPTGINTTNGYATANQKGIIYLKELPENITLHYNNLILPLQIGYENSHYLDLDLTGNQFKEPTLSNRTIYTVKDASEIAQRFIEANAIGNSNHYLENYSIVAPPGKTIHVITEYPFIGDQRNYYAYNQSNNIEAITEIIFSKESSILNQIETDSIQQWRITLPEEIESANYNIQGVLSDGTTVNIAQFRITTKPYNVIEDREGDALTTLESLKSNYEYVTGIWLDNNKENTPLAWNMSEMAYYYEPIIREDNKAKKNEYRLLREYQAGEHCIKDRYSIEHNDSNGFFCLFEKESEKRVIISKCFTLEHSCNTDSLWITLWIMPLTSDSETDIILNLEGLNKQTGSYETIAQYHCGYLNTPNSRWSEIGTQFPSHSDIYNNYRIQVISAGYNSNQGAIAIDQLAIYIPPTSVRAVSLQNACKGKDIQKGVIMKLDYNTLSEYSDNETLHFWQLGNERDDTYRDSLWSCSDTLQRRYPTFFNSSIDEAMEKLTLNYQAVTLFYLDDTISRPKTSYLYLFIPNTMMEETMSYLFKIAPDTTFTNASKECCFTYNGSGVTHLDNIPITHNQGVCPTLNGEFTFERKVNEIGYSVTLENRNYDWLLRYRDNTHLDSIVNVIAKLHADTNYLKERSIDITRTNLLREEKLLLTNLINTGNLILSTPSIQTKYINSNNTFILFPYSEKVTIDDSFIELSICEEPIWITPPIEANAPWFTLGKKDEGELPLHISDVRIARLTVNNINESNIKLPLKASNIKIGHEGWNGKVILKSSTDTLFRNWQDSILFHHVEYQEAIEGDSILISQRNSLSPLFNIGHSYNLIITIENADGCNGYEELQLLAHPNALVWHGDSNSSWNHDGNWHPANTNGSKAVDIPNGSYAPTTAMNIIIPKTNSIPILYKEETDDLERNENLLWELTHNRNSCKHIHVMAQGNLIGQEHMNYDSAWVEIEIPTRQWILLSSPITGLVSGDMHIPQSGTYSAQLFNPTDACDNRLSNPFWQSLYNRYVESTDYNGTVRIGSTTWSAPANGLNTIYAPKSGFAIWTRTSDPNDTSVILRLPKSEDIYAYHGADDLPSSHTVTVNRPNNYYKLADCGWEGYTHETYTDNNIILLGNP